MRETKRDTIIERLIVNAETDKRILVVDPDVGSATRTWNFGQVYPERFFEMGIAEQNAYGVAAGLASCGYNVFAATFAVFASMRAVEMIRTSVAYPRLNVKVIGGYAGISNGKDGATHQSVEDVAIMRSLPNMTVLSVADKYAADKITDTLCAFEGPAYLRAEYDETGEVYDENSIFEIGKANVLREGKDCTIITYGSAVVRAMVAAEELAESGIEAGVIDMFTLKPLDEAAIVKAAETTGAIITVEDHSMIGGIGSAVAEVIACRQLSCKFARIAIRDVYTESGLTEQLRDKYGIGKKDIIGVVKNMYGGKKDAEQTGKTCI